MLRVACAVVAGAFRAIRAPRPRVVPLRITNAFVSTANPRPLFSCRSFYGVQPKQPLITNAFVSTANPRRSFYGVQPKQALITALDSEIKFTQFMPLRPAAPANFPFKVDDDIRHELRFSRDLDGEEIIVTVQEVHDKDDDNGTSRSSTDSDSDDDNGTSRSSTDSDSDDDNGTSRSSTDSDSDDDDNGTSRTDSVSTTRDAVGIKVKVSKANGKSMKFAATASADEIVIQRLTTEEGDDNVICSELYIKPDSELQFALRDFLEIRGIHKSTAAFLYDYSAWKSKLQPDSRIKSVEAYSAQNFPPENVETLTKLKEVIQGW